MWSAVFREISSLSCTSLCNPRAGRQAGRRAGRSLTVCLGWLGLSREENNAGLAVLNSLARTCVGVRARFLCWVGTMMSRLF